MSSFEADDLALDKIARKLSASARQSRRRAVRPDGQRIEMCHLAENGRE
jgi:hypothetical protein